MEAINSLTTPAKVSSPVDGDAATTPQNAAIDVFDAPVAEPASEEKPAAPGGLFGVTLILPAQARGALDAASRFANGLAMRARLAAADAIDTLAQAGFSAVNEAQRIIEAVKNR